MDKYLRPGIKVPFESLYLDPNNPRLYVDDPPGYLDVQRLFDQELQKLLEVRVEQEFGVDELMQAVIGNGWMPIDAIVVWEHPDGSQRNVVLEGNRRIVTLRKLRGRLAKEQEKLERMRSGKTRVAGSDLRKQERLVSMIEQIISDTANIDVVPLDAADPDELERKLPRVLGVRHIAGPKGWGNFAEDLWLLRRYDQLFEDDFPGQDRRWEPSIIERVAGEASLTKLSAKRQLLASSAFSHFTAEYETELPGDEEFGVTDYYLFENIVKKPWLREQFGFGENDQHLPEESERVLFDWVFKLRRPRKAEDNENIFYRHENALLWEKIKRYDDKHGTAFAKQFDVENHDEAPRMREIEADYLAHMARKKPGDVLDSLLKQLGSINEATIEEEGLFLEQQLKRLEKRVQALMAMITAAAQTQAA
jgi:hypothetical protein